MLHCRLTTEEDGDGVADADNMRESTETATLSRERQEEMRGIAASDDVVALLTRSFAPSIVEMDDVKLGLLCQLFGGSNKNYADAAMGKFRGELNVLLIGDPGTSKSQLLQYVHKVAPRGIYTSGKGSSAVGLTAYITRDPDTKEVVLDSGALVLSDRGICCIDEFDKMSENARSVLHEVCSPASHKMRLSLIPGAGHGAADHQHSQVRHHLHAQRANINPRGCQPGSVQVQPAPLCCRESQSSAVSSLAFRSRVCAPPAPQPPVHR
jgi:hypothetical protein